ncbi:MAG: translational GTPase TypA [Desulfomicrobium sp.]|nr:translational GTPase TypA [Pseudomonadota bacterium]MBV1710629.1 translational GTPase TypA [Desulfomicrobium sp.]MBU4570237.1 translational GTPase TypA [Pseudomonadota bacterium]MBU4593157.1 translational GTPase TypA [Pseudomonadota bacterium]MBV1720359.1 translational GTPase TypA [Desulfomicrobium sp.]
MLYEENMPSKQINDKIRNIAIIAHVDHGKTTLVDVMFRQSGVFRDNQAMDDRVMDSMDLERERGITIAAKNCSVRWKGVKINIVDTPGHADFGGEVERALSMVDGAVLLVDSSEGPLPQTRFVLKKALDASLPILVVVNKIDRADARPQEVLDEVYDLFIDLGADEDQLEFPVLYAIGRDGVASPVLEEPGKDLSCLFDLILERISGPRFDPEAPFQMLVSDLGYSDYLGRLVIGKIKAGVLQEKVDLLCMGENDQLAFRPNKVQAYEGMQLKDQAVVEMGDIVVLAGLSKVSIGDTICLKEFPVRLKRLDVDEPTVSMRFTINTSPFAGREGKIVQSRKIKDRLEKEALTNVAIEVEESEDKDSMVVKGRGEFQLAIIIETMRREGFELGVGRPEVIYKKDGGKLLEPMEHVYVDCDEAFMGVVTEKLSMRRGKLLNLVNNGGGRVRMEFSVPSRALIGYRDEFLTDTKGTGIMNSLFDGYGEYRGDFPTRFSGSIVSDRQGQAVPYAIFNLDPRGRMFIRPGDAVYEGMIVGEHNRDNDIDVNPCKEKKLTNMRASGKDEAIILTPVLPMTLEMALNFIRDDEMVEITPQNIRLRKIELCAQKRHTTSARKKKSEGK